MPTTPTAQTDNQSTSNKTKTIIIANSYAIYWYMAIVVVCIGFGIATYMHQTGRFEKSRQQILRAYEESMQKYDSIRTLNLPRQLEQVVEGNKKHQEEVRALLELEFNKMQNEYETQEIWTGIITVVFLIFSFYSLFKSEELERHSHTALASIKQSETEAKAAYGNIETEKKKKLGAIQTEYDDWKQLKDSEIRNLFTNQKQLLENTIQQKIETAIQDLSSKYKDISTNFVSGLNIQYKTSESELVDLYKKEADDFISLLREKNAQEIQFQVDLWSEKLNELKDYFERQMNQLIENYNPIVPDDQHHDDYLDDNMEEDSLLSSNEEVKEVHDDDEQ